MGFQKGLICTELILIVRMKSYFFSNTLVSFLTIRHLKQLLSWSPQLVTMPSRFHETCLFSVRSILITIFPSSSLSSKSYFVKLFCYKMSFQISLKKNCKQKAIKIFCFLEHLNVTELEKDCIMPLPTFSVSIYQSDLKLNFPDKFLCGNVIPHEMQIRYALRPVCRGMANRWEVTAPRRSFLCLHTERLKVRMRTVGPRKKCYCSWTALWPWTLTVWFTIVLSLLSCNSFWQFHSRSVNSLVS